MQRSSYKRTLAKSRRMLPKLMQLEEQLTSESPKPMIKRDIQMFKEFCLGESNYTQLAIKYNLTYSRVSQIVRYVLEYVIATKPAAEPQAKGLQ